MPLIEMHLGIKIKRFRPLKEKMQTTVERTMDFFYEVETEDGQKFILHLEFQTDDDHEMVYRSGEYHGMALRRKKMKIRHLVIYLGEKTPTMPTKLKEEEVYKGFELLNIHEMDLEKLLASQVPEVMLLAILSNYSKDRVEEILRAVVNKLRKVSKNANLLSRYFKQLVFLSRLRKFEDLTIKITKEMPITYDIRTDYLFNEGLKEGVQEGLQKGLEKELLLKKQAVRNMLARAMEISLIAAILEISVAEVETIRVELEKDKRRKKLPEA